MKILQYISKLKNLRKIGRRNKANLVLNTLERALRRPRLLSYPVSLDIEATTICNLNCIFCIKYPHKPLLSLPLPDFRKIAKALFPYAARVSFCSGGEPFLNKNFMDFLAACKQYKTLITVVSNGTLLSEKLCGELMRNEYLESFSFSFDGAKKETVEFIRKGIDHDKVVNNIRTMCGMKKRFRGTSAAIQIRCSVMKSNIGELPDLVRSASKWGVDRVVVSYVIISNDIDKKESLFYHPQLRERIFQEAAAVAGAEHIQLSFAESILHYEHPALCSYPWSFLKISPDGSVRFCYRAWENPVGNIFAVRKFHDLWNNQHYQQIRKTINTAHPYFKYCSVCDVRIGYFTETAHFYCLDKGLYTFDI